MTERDYPDSIDPSLEHLHAECEREIQNGRGVIWIEGLGILVNLHGFEPALKFVRRIVDTTRGTQWAIVLTMDPLTLEDTAHARIRREATPLIAASPTNRASRFRGAIISSSDSDSSGKDVQNPESLSSESLVFKHTIPEAESEISGTNSSETIEEFESTANAGNLADKTRIDCEPPEILSRIPPAALDESLLEKRMEQWSAQGFDVSMVELALGLEGEARSEVYIEVEDKVRRAVECLQRIHRLERPRFSIKVAKLRFRAFQLTALDSVEGELDRLESAGHL